ncbi:hypothetical protein KH0155_10770 [Helicobacter pylori]
MNKNHITEIREREILKEKIIELLKKSEDQNKLIAIAINWGVGDRKNLFMEKWISSTY